MAGNRNRIAAATLAGLAAVALAVTSCSKGADQTQTGMPAAADTIATAEHGAYIATITGCHDCHTPGTLHGAPDFQRALSGSELGWTGPWGTTYARNLTPDMETGLGAWTEDDIVHALQTGKRPDGTDLRPPMPWPDFAHMTKKDVRSVAMYLKALVPIKHKVPDALPPGAKATGSFLVLPAPSEWDVPPKPATK